MVIVQCLNHIISVNPVIVNCYHRNIIVLLHGENVFVMRLEIILGNYCLYVMLLKITNQFVRNPFVVTGKHSSYDAILRIAFLRNQTIQEIVYFIGHHPLVVCGKRNHNIWILS